MTDDDTRQRRPSKRSVATRARILDAAEIVFAQKGFDGATIRNIAEQAGEPVSLVHHHGGGKERLFHQTVARRAADLSEARLRALSLVKQQGNTSLEATLTAFFGPYLALAKTGPHWLSYARLVAFVSADPRWRALAADHFDPTANLFIDEIAATLPQADRRVIATGFIFSVSAMLALVTARWRISSLTGKAGEDANELGVLVSYCAAGIRATATTA